MASSVCGRVDSERPIAFLSRHELSTCRLHNDDVTTATVQHAGHGGCGASSGKRSKPKYICTETRAVGIVGVPRLASDLLTVVLNK